MRLIYRDVIRHTALLIAPDLRVDRIDHPGDQPHRDPAAESSSSYSVSFVEQGGFDIRCRDESRMLRQQDVLVTRPSQVYSCRHPGQRTDDVCLTVSFYTEAMEADGAQMDVVYSSGRRMTFPATNRLRYLHRSLLALLASKDTAAGAENLAISLWQALADAPPRRLYRDAQLGWYAERVEAARKIIEARFADKLTLSDLARSVGMSPFHFCRIFTELAGMPPHRCLLEVRLRAAAAMLRAGADSVTDACFRSGFRDLSHFIRLFQRRFGATPSRYAG